MPGAPPVIASSDSSRLDQAEVHRAGKFAVEDQEIDHLRRRDPAVPLAIHLQGAGALQQRRPLDRVERRADVGGTWAAA